MAARGSLYGYEVSSDVPLRRLLPAPGPRGRIDLRRANGSLAGDGVLVHSISDRGTSFALTRLGARLHVACSASGEFLVDGWTVHAAPPAGDLDVWEHRLVTTAIPLALSERGDLVLHGAALLHEGRAVVLAGTTTRGKSTTALAAARLGVRLLAEDAVGLDRDARVWPGPTGLRIGEAGCKRTVFLDDAAHARDPMPAGAVVVLGARGGRLSVERVGPAAAMPLVLPHLIYGGSDRLRSAFAQCAGLLARVPVYRASFPDGLDLLPAAVEELLTRVAAPPRG